jgi:hypothetical protein
VVVPIVEKMVETRLRWFGHVTRRLVVRRVVKSLEAVGDIENCKRNYHEGSRD